MNANNRFFILLSITASILFLCMTSCSNSKKTLEDKCILMDPNYSKFVNDHNLEADIEDFLSKENKK